MRDGRRLRVVWLAAALVLLISPSETAREDNVVADDQIVQGNLCVGATCADGVVQEQQAAIRGQQKVVQEQQRAIAELTARINALEPRR
jgi:hypothetical protein